MVCFLGTLLYSCSSCFSKIPNPKLTNLAGSLDGAPIHRHFTNSKTKTLSRDQVSYSTSFTQLAFDASEVFTGCSAIATATRALAALLLFEAITLPPP